MVSAGDWRKWVSTIAEWMDKDTRKEVLFHELVHAIAGRAMVERQETVHFLGDPFTSKEVQLQRTGLRYNHKFRKGMQRGAMNTPSRFRWLNEAVTERIAMRILGMQASESYREERDELQKMVDSGVDEQLFIDAYFEDYDPTLPKGVKKVPAFTALIKTVHAKMGRGYLRAVDERMG